MVIVNLLSHCFIISVFIGSLQDCEKELGRQTRLSQQEDNSSHFSCFLLKSLYFNVIDDFNKEKESNDNDEENTTRSSSSQRLVSTQSKSQSRTISSIEYESSSSSEGFKILLAYITYSLYKQLNF